MASCVRPLALFSLALFALTGCGLVRYPIWRWHHGDVDSLKGVPWGSFPLPLQAQRAKQQAVRCFESQLHAPDGPPVLPPRVLEYFARPYEAFLL